MQTSNLEECILGDQPESATEYGDRFTKRQEVLTHRL
jgi:hypothetical protein